VREVSDACTQALQSALPATPRHAPQKPSVRRSKTSPWARAAAAGDSDDSDESSRQAAVAPVPIWQKFARSKTGGSQLLRAGSMKESVGPRSVQELEANLARGLLSQRPVGRRGKSPKRQLQEAARQDEDEEEEAEEAAPAQVATSSRKSFVRIMPDPIPVEEPEVVAKQPSKVGAHASDNSGASNDSRQDNKLLMSVTATSSGNNVRIRNRKRTMTSDQILQQRMRELAEEASLNFQWTTRSEGTELATSRFKAIPIAFFLFGLLPWDECDRPRLSKAYQWALRAIAALCVIAFILPASTVSALTGGFACAEGEVCWQQGTVGMLPLPVGAVFIFVQFYWQHVQEPLEETFLLLHDVSVERGYVQWLSRTARLEKVGFAVMWLCIMVGDILNIYLSAARMLSVSAILHCASIGLFSGVILCVTYGMVRVCHSMSTLVDVFCCEVVGKIRLREIGHLWNMTQATMRQASTVVEMCVLTLIFVLSFAVPCLLVDGGLMGDNTLTADNLIAGLLVTCGILYMLLLAAMISEKSTRVPALVNAISFGSGTEWERQLTVDYIASSAAGFYVCGMRLTSGLIAKVMYAWCIIAVSLITRLVTPDNSQSMSGGMGI